LDFYRAGQQTATALGKATTEIHAGRMFGFLLNALAVYIVTDVAQISYLYAAIFMVTVTPVSVFILGKLWAFS
jgi:hypothetical protein